MLYARSRRFVMSVLVLLLGALVLYCGANWWWDGRLSLRPLAVLMTLGAASAATGLVGPDPGLDRTAALSWPHRRAAHLLGLAGLVLAVSLGLSHVLVPAVPGQVIIRDTLGLTGLLGLGATLFGGPLSWCLPFAALMLAYVPGLQQVPIAGWLVQPWDHPSAIVTAAAAMVLGIVGYSVFGVRGS
ncbi:hypothetical protein [Sciscionella sediminilitoris]|uniref:hypothetical protein n=1 Tax=Sciscionella sediminilitoris TaxID=1445613 RepID=UPI0012E17015|nr:hypothetical protein [Sciscionella sp. SE31]